jgi:hypothetical protein
VGFLKRLLGGEASSAPALAVDVDAALRAVRAADTEFREAVTHLVIPRGGDETLQVVGESYRQDALWRLVGGIRAEEVRQPVVAELRPEPDNPVDENAVAVLIDGQLVGYLSRDDAHLYLPGIRRLIAAEGAVHLDGWICGGGPRADGLGRLGVFLDHDPADFGIADPEPVHATLDDVPAGYGFRTGLSSARSTDLEDDSYDLSWIDALPTAVPHAIAQLRKLLADNPDPIDRHFMFAELESRLYSCRDAFASALDEYDEVCRQHDAAMEEIRAALFAKFGRLPLLETYKQAAIRCSKAKDWEAVKRWCERGISVYGDDAARPDAVEDLRKRLAHAETKIELRDRPPARPSRPSTTPTAVAIETLTCSVCGGSFERQRTRGRKPHACPRCRGIEATTFSI